MSSGSLLRLLPSPPARTAGIELSLLAAFLQLYRSEQRKTQRLLALVSLGTAVTNAQDMAALLDQALRLAVDFSGHDEGSLMLLGDNGRALVVRAVLGGDAARLSTVMPLSAKGIASWVLRNKEPLYLEGRAEHLADVARSYRKDVPSSVTLPLLTPRRRALGVLSLNSTRRVASLNEGDMDVLQVMANELAGAIENAQLYQDLWLKDQQLQESARRLVAAQQEERRRVAHDIHDGLAQMLVAVNQHMETYRGYRTLRASPATQQFEQAQTLLKRSLEEVRRVIADLRPSVLDDFGLEQALRSLLAGLQEEAGWTVDFRYAVGDAELPAHIETTVFRIIQEATTNIRKHARSRRVQVQVVRRAGAVEVKVRDWGIGFAPSSAPSSPGPGQRVGLVGMAERAALLGGKLNLRSSPGRGTTVSVRLPLAILPSQASEGSEGG